MLNMENCGMRYNMSKMFTQKKISMNTRVSISQVFGSIQEKYKERLAAKIVAMMESGKTEEELIATAQQLR